MSVEEDLLKSNYNNIVLGKNHGVSHNFFDFIIREKLSNMLSYANKLKNHPNKSLFYETIDFWTEEYKNLFKPLLLTYYINLDEFKKLYFMIKQI